MTKDLIIEKSMRSLNKLPIEKVVEVSDYIEFLSVKYNDNDAIREGIKTLVDKSQSFSFLNEEEELYSVKDLKEIY